MVALMDGETNVRSGFYPSGLYPSGGHPDPVIHYLMNDMSVLGSLRLDVTPRTYAGYRCSLLQSLELPFLAND
jgi:hypothetical protein